MRGDSETETILEGNLKKPDEWVLCSSVLMLSQDYNLYKTYKGFLYEHLFLIGNDASYAHTIRFLIRLMANLDRENGHDSFTKSGMEAQIKFFEPDTIKAEEHCTNYNKLLSKDKIKEAMTDNGTLAAFVKYLQLCQFYRVGTSFKKAVESCDIQEASKLMIDAISGIDKINSGDSVTLDEDMIDKYLFSEESGTSKKDSLMFGKTVSDEGIISDRPCQFDDILGGFEPQTLSVFIATTGGGKSMMTQHIIKCSVDQKMHVWVGVLEEREKTFIMRLISSLTGISMSELSRKNELTKEKIAKIELARKNIKEYVRVEFIGAKPLNVVHKIAEDYDLDLKRAGQEHRIPKVNVVDYSGHVAADEKGDSVHNSFRYAYALRKDYALRNRKICFDFAQVNREGMKNMKTGEVIKIHHLASGYDLSQVCDNIISINRNDTEDIPYNKARLHFCKTRDSANGATMSLNVDFGKCSWDMNSSEKILKGS